jgi:hypothetical protein
MSGTKNVVSVVIPKEKLAEMQGHVSALQTLLTEFLVALTPLERQKLAKANDKTMPFVDKSFEYAKTNPEFVPGYLDMKEFETDMTATSDLKTLLNPLSQLNRGLEDTVMLSSSEAYQSALTYYNNVKQAAKMSVPNAKNIADDLGKRFEQTSKKTAAKP